MPDHLHLLVTPAVDASLENFIKGGDWLHSSASGQYTLDPAPERFLHLPSGATALAFYAGTPGLKPRPPEGRQP